MVQPGKQPFAHCSRAPRGMGKRISKKRQNSQVEIKNCLLRQKKTNNSIFLCLYIYIYIQCVFNPVQTGSSQCHKAGFNDFNVPFNSGFSSLELVSADVPLIVLCRISPWYFHHDGGSFLTYMRLCYTSFLSFDHQQHQPYFYRKKIIKTTFPFYQRICYCIAYSL